MSGSAVEWVVLGWIHAHAEGPYQPQFSEWIWKQITYKLRVQRDHFGISSWASIFQTKPRTSWESKSTMAGSAVEVVYLSQLRTSCGTISTTIQWVDLKANHAQTESSKRPFRDQQLRKFISREITHILRDQIHHVVVSSWVSSFGKIHAQAESPNQPCRGQQFSE